MELGEGVYASCKLNAEEKASKAAAAEAKPDLSSLTSMLAARWKGGGASGDPKSEPLREGQVRSFKISGLDAGTKRIEVELA